MAYGTPDPYYQPEKFGLTITESEDRGGAWEFDMFVIWQDEEGHAYWGQDAGCSCPSPFENVTNIDQLEHGTLAQAYDALAEWQDYHDSTGPWHRRYGLLGKDGW